MTREPFEKAYKVGAVGDNITAKSVLVPVEFRRIDRVSAPLRKATGKL